VFFPPSFTHPSLVDFYLSGYDHNQMDDPFLIKICDLPEGTVISHGLINAISDEFLARLGPIPQHRVEHLVAEFAQQPDPDYLPEHTQEILDEIYDSNFGDLGI